MRLRRVSRLTSLASLKVPLISPALSGGAPRRRCYSLFRVVRWEEFLNVSAMSFCIIMSSSPADEGTEKNNNDFTVTPWEVEGDIDYTRLIEKFGTQPIT